MIYIVLLAIFESGHYAGLGIRSSVFRVNRSFLPKNERMSDSLQKNERFTHSLIFGERPERFAHDRTSFLSDLSDLLTSLI